MVDLSLERGKCHMCAEMRPVKFCERCQHFFCEECGDNYLGRTLEFLKEKLGGPRPDCCGVIFNG